MSRIFDQGFTGAHQDFITFAYPLGNGYRCYLPGLMRFNAVDGFSPFGFGGINPYVYCANDPINYSDPTGHVISPVLEDEAIVRDLVNNMVKRVAAQADAPDTVVQAEKASGAAMDRVEVQGPSTSRVEEGSPAAKRMRSGPGTSAAAARGVPETSPQPAVPIAPPPAYDEVVAALNRNVGIQPPPNVRNVPPLWENWGMGRIRALNAQLDDLDNMIFNETGLISNDMFLDSNIRINNYIARLNPIFADYNNVRSTIENVFMQGENGPGMRNLHRELWALHRRISVTNDSLEHNAYILGIQQPPQ